MKKIESILLIDDDDADNDYHEIVISESGIQTTVSNINDSRKALKFLEKNMQEAEGRIPALIFLDINMPAINGFELLDRLCSWSDPHNRKDHLNVFILSTSLPPDYKILVKKYRGIIKGFYTKPLTQKILLEILQEHF